MKKSATEVKLEFICTEIKELKSETKSLRADINKGKGAIWIMVILGGMITGLYNYFLGYILMANTYKNTMFDLTTTNKTTIYTCPTTTTALIKTVQVTNIDTGNIEVEMFATDASNSDAEHELAHVTINSKTVDNLAKGTIVLEAGDVLKLQAATANKIAGIISILEIDF